MSNVEKETRTVAASAMALEVSKPVLPTRVVIIPNLQVFMNSLSSLTFSSTGTSSFALAVYGSEGLSPVEALLYDILDALSDDF